MAQSQLRESWHVCHCQLDCSTLGWFSWAFLLYGPFLLMIALANAWFRAFAPDYRGYGLSDSPPEPEKASYADLTKDLFGILDALNIPKHPERVLGIITIGVPYMPPGPTTFSKHLPEGFYISRWQEPGRAEADFGRLDAKTVVRNVYILFSRPEIPIAAENESGGEEFNITDPIVKVPALLIMEGKDYVFKFPGMEDYVNSGKVKEFVPDLDIIYLPEGTHFVQEQAPQELAVNEEDGLRLITWLRFQSLKGSRVVVFIHGFPEIWYSWRHQMISLAKAGYRVIAPDLRGYGLSQPHPLLHEASFDDFVEDTLSILDSLHIQKAFLVGKDFGSWAVYLFSLIHPTRVAGIISLGVPFFLPNPQRYLDLPEGFYIFRWKEPGRAEADFGRFDVKTVVRSIYILFSRSEIPIAHKDQEIMDLVDSSIPLPAWFTDEDLATYAALYETSGLDSPMQVPYKGLHKYNQSTITDPKVEAPVLLIMGGKDYFLKFPGIEDYMESGKMREYVPDLEVKWLPNGTHFMQEQFPDQVNQLIISFLDQLI
ncbi:hypothetical protein FNV43_RR07604 [Rhamnella rubrinervis]|uniref:AB hydrolase-1 domain-containing protein n=1 Tax=Rhamnella rubrinervis TaxID=2594499 RepID=A0A8K0HG29_9ROSA|nr:hypothetical protein FNV43_RR07604 [Rhamnella rubrinervis]